jgi:hypothetical protein
VGEALLSLEIAEEIEVAADGEGVGGQRDVSGMKLGGDVCSGGLFADDEDLRGNAGRSERCEEGRGVG